MSIYWCSDYKYHESEASPEENEAIEVDLESESEDEDDTSDVLDTIFEEDDLPEPGNLGNM